MGVGAGENVGLQLLLGCSGEGVAPGQRGCGHLAGLRERSEAHFIVPGQQGVFPDVIEVELKEVLLLATLPSRLGHERLPGLAVSR